MEYVDGTTVKESVRAHGAIDESEVRRIMIETAKALKYAHDQDIVHRDVKSGNVMRRDDGAVKIMDFGLAKVIREYQREHTQQVGTPYYMSPEQIIGKNVDPRSDLYGLGCTAFECVTGRVPFEEGELAYHHRHTEPPSPSEVNPNVSQPMERFILTLMEKEPDARYQSADQVIQVLQHMPD
jgi:serine/threonine-protein kinase